MNVSTRLKERFCKDCNVQIKIYEEPFFMERIELFDKFYDTKHKWNLFKKELEKYSNEQDYLTEYNKVKDTAIMNIKESEAYIKFNNEDMNQYAVTYKGLSNKDIFKPSNDTKTFISIDITKANFTSLRHYDETMFQDESGIAETWEDYIGKFTNNKHIINSKYIRQVILGNCNPKRHITYEKYLMNGFVTWLIESFVSIDRIVFFSNDEIVIDVSDMDKEKQTDLQSQMEYKAKVLIPVKIELFTLYKIKGADGYYKKIYTKDGIKIEFKCVNNYMLPFVLRKTLGQEIMENDKVFIHEGLLSKFIEIPKIEVML